VRPYSQRQPFARKDVLIQGDSVRAIWESSADGEPQPPRKPLRRDPPPIPAALIPTDNVLHLRIAEELEYARRLLDLMGDELSGDPAIVSRHGRALQSFDIVGQMLGHLTNVIRSSDPEGAVERIGMAELKARLMRRSAL
jgi:hypothetical protein